MYHLSFPFSDNLQEMLTVSELLECNEFTSRYGLHLEQQQACHLAEVRKQSLTGNGRIEFGGGVLRKLVISFCDSPYLSQAEYADTLATLTSLFFYYKNESLDAINDNDLLNFMKQHFDTDCHGSIELLVRDLDWLVHHLFAEGENKPCFDSRDKYLSWGEFDE